MATKSLAFGSQKPQRKQLAVDGKGGFAGELGDLRADLQAAFKKFEARDGYPEANWLDGGAPAAAGGDLVIKGALLLQGQSFASQVIGTGTSELTFTALKPGVGGNDLTITISDTGSLTVTKTGNAIVITINAGTTTADALATAINADAADTDGYLRCESGGVGTTIAEQAATALSGGVGEGWECSIGGVECLPANETGTSPSAKVAEAQATVTVPDLTSSGFAAGDIASLVVKSDGVVTQSVDFALA